MKVISAIPGIYVPSPILRWILRKVDIGYTLYGDNLVQHLPLGVF